MAQTSKLLDQTVVQTAQTALKKMGRHGYVATKLHAVISAHLHGITSVAKIYGVSRTTLTMWIKHVKALSVEKLTTPARRTQSKLNQAQKAIIQQWISKNPNITIHELRLLIEKEMKMSLGKSTVHRLMQSLGYAYITPRPVHHEQNKESHEAFKKKSKRHRMRTS